MVKKRSTLAVNKFDAKIVAALLKMYTDIELTWKPKEIRLLSEQIVCLSRRVKSTAEFTREMVKFSDQLEELERPRQYMGRLMARELSK